MIENQDEIRPGWVAYDREGEKIGQVEDVAPDHVLVSRGLIPPKDLFIPRSAIRVVEPAAGSIQLKVPADQIEAMGWDEPPLVDTAFGQTVTQTGETTITEGMLLDQRPRVSREADRRTT
jgi:hypothetical protein